MMPITLNTATDERRCERSFDFDMKKVDVEKDTIKSSSAPVDVERKEIDSTQVSSGPTARVDRVQELSNTIHASRVNTLVTAESAACFKHESALLSMLSKADKKAMLEEITPSVLNLDKKGKQSGVNAAVLLCKFMQCVLWDAGFRHTMLKFQFDALLASTGIDVKVLLDILLNLSVVKQPLLVCQSNKGQKLRLELCKTSISFIDTKGLLLADAIGLGKTIEGIGAAILRSHICKIKGVSSLPTLIVAPTAAFLNQWERALSESGVPASHITRFVRDDQQKLREDEWCFILLSRHSLMAETRHVLKGRRSNLFPFLPIDLLELLQHTRTRGGSVDKITRAIGKYSKSITRKRFRTLIIDECHAMRNLLTFDGIGGALLGTAAERTVPMTSTPFISSTGDLATLMVFIDPTMPSAYKAWWKEATKRDPSASVIEKAKSWRKFYFMRRDQDILCNELSAVKEAVVHVQCFEPELAVYKRCEQSFITTFEGYKKSSDPGLTLGKKDLTGVLLLYLMKMRMCLIHPLILKGREFTIRFSPTRRHLEAKLSRVLCVCCAMETNDKLVPVPSDMCYAAGSPSPHYIHPACLGFIQRTDSAKCPRCKGLDKQSSMSSSSMSYPSHCANIQVLPGISGFKSTAKIEKLISWAQSVPTDDKAIIFSFFEGALDLIEGVFTEDLGIDCTRLDIGLGPEEQAADLLRFKESSGSHFLLTTVQNCGSGLNIEEANHIAFLDRWFDSSIHQQAVNRCHNINQTKPVSVVYFDAELTVDEVMKARNDSLSKRTSVTLADGTVIGAQQRSLTYQDITGPIYRMIKAVSKERRTFISANFVYPIFPHQDALGFKTHKYKGPLQVCNSSPPSILKERSFGSGRKSTSGGKHRRVAFTLFPQNEVVGPACKSSKPEIQSYHEQTLFSPRAAYTTQQMTYKSSIIQDLFHFLPHQTPCSYNPIQNVRRL